MALPKLGPTRASLRLRKIRDANVSTPMDLGTFSADKMSEKSRTRKTLEREKFASTDSLLTSAYRIHIIGVCLYSFLQARKFQLFDNLDETCQNPFGLPRTDFVKVYLHEFRNGILSGTERCKSSFS